MSHKATNWAFSQTGLKPADKLLLLCLADRHNPDHGCFPSQQMLAEDACMARATVNRTLGKLEEAGLIRRVRRVDPRTRRQLATRYILGFEPEFTQEPCLNLTHGSDGTEEEQSAEPCLDLTHGSRVSNLAEPCLKSGPSRVSNRDTNLVKEPVTNPRMRARGRPDGPRATPARPAQPPPGDGDLAAFYADLVNADGFLPPSMISNTMRDAMLTRGLVTAERLRERGVR